MFARYSPNWAFGIPRSEPPTSYDYVKDLKYIKLNEDLFLDKFPPTNTNLKNAFISTNKVIYQVQFHGAITSIYQICFNLSVQEDIQDFINWLEEELSGRNGCQIDLGKKKN